MYSSKSHTYIKLVDTNPHLNVKIMFVCMMLQVCELS